MQKASKITNTSLLMKIFNVYTDVYISAYQIIVCSKKKKRQLKGPVFQRKHIFNVYT